MNFVTALAICLGIIGGFLAYLYLGPMAGTMHIWMIFIATAMGVALGGTNESFKNMVVCGVAGMLVAWAASLVIINVSPGLPLPVWAGIVVGAGTAAFTLLGLIPIFSAIPATVVGYAGTFAYLLGNPKVLLSNDVLLGMTVKNPLLNITLSLVIAAAFGIVSLKLATMMSTKAVVAPAPAE